MHTSSSLYSWSIINPTAFSKQILWFYLFIAGLIYGCSPLVEERDCSCPFQITLGKDGTFSVTKIEGGQVEVDLELSGKIRKLLDVQLGGKYSTPKKHSIEFREIIQEITLDPELADKIVVGQAFFCTYHRLICQNTSFTENEIMELSLAQLEKFEIYIKKFSTTEFILTGSVHIAGSENPLADVEISFFSSTAPSKRISKKSDPDGLFVFEDLSAGDQLQLRIQHPDYHAKTVEHTIVNNVNPNKLEPVHLYPRKEPCLNWSFEMGEDYGGQKIVISYHHQKLSRILDDDGAASFCIPRSQHGGTASVRLPEIANCSFHAVIGQDFGAKPCPINK